MIFVKICGKMWNAPLTLLWNIPQVWTWKWHCQKAQLFAIKDGLDFVKPRRLIVLRTLRHDYQAQEPFVKSCCSQTFLEKGLHCFHLYCVPIFWNQCEYYWLMSQPSFVEQSRHWQGRSSKGNDGKQLRSYNNFLHFEMD